MLSHTDLSPVLHAEADPSNTSISLGGTSQALSIGQEKGKMNPNTKFILIDINFVLIVQYVISLYELILIFSKIKKKIIKKEVIEEKKE